MDGQIEVRDAAATDAGVLVEFNTAMAAETEGKRLAHDAVSAGVAAVLKDPRHGFYLVAEVDSAVVGSLLVTSEWSDWRNAAFWWIQSVYVLPAMRRQGVFRALHEAVRARASEKVCGLRLYVERDNKIAQATYARLGMAEAHYKMYEQQIS